MTQQTEAVHFKLRKALKDRAEACAAMDGASLTEFIRAAIRDRCRMIERNDRSFEETLDGIRREGL